MFSIILQKAQHDALLLWRRWGVSTKKPLLSMFISLQDYLRPNLRPFALKKAPWKAVFWVSQGIVFIMWTASCNNRRSMVFLLSPTREYGLSLPPYFAFQLASLQLCITPRLPGITHQSEYEMLSDKICQKSASHAL